MKKPLITALILLFTMASLAQGNYSKRNLMQLSDMEFNQFDWKAQKLQKKGEKLAIYGGIAGLAGMGIGSLNSNDSMSSGSSDLVTGLAAVMFVVGSVATIVGIPMFIIGIVRCTRINEARVLRNARVHIKFVPFNNYCRHTHTNYSGISVRLSF